MAKKETDNTEYKALRAAEKDGSYAQLYIFHGEERYLLEHCLGMMRKMADQNGLGSFNHRRIDGKTMELGQLADAIDALPVFADRTLIEVYDYNLFRSSKSDDEDDEAETENDLNKKLDSKNKNESPEQKELLEILSDLPEYVCLVFIYDTIKFSPDRRKAATKQILKNAHVVEFAIQGQSELVKWVRAHYKALGKQIRPDDAEYLAFITGGLMNTMLGEIEKTAAYSKGDVVTREDIDAVVTPVLDAVSWKLTDAIASGDFKTAARITDELLQLREPPHKLIHGITLKMRQLYAAKLCVESGKSAEYLMELADMRYEFQAKLLMKAAGNVSRETARLSVIECAEAAFRMNSSSEPENALKDLLLRLADRRNAF